jgi:pimeloyl-ACP methyl ester carboxylesterase
MTIYCFSGLGADKRVFTKLDLSGHDLIFIDWKLPLPAENLAQYAQRVLQEQILVRENIALLGVSFGGIVAGEVAKSLPAVPLILVSSLQNAQELPFYYRWAGKLYIDMFMPSFLLKQPNALAYYFFGVVGKEEKDLLKAILKDTDSRFLKWAIRQIVTWQGIPANNPLLHLHGNRDRILPFHFVKNASKIQDGGHFMVLNKAEEISEKILLFLENKKRQPFW